MRERIAAALRRRRVELGWTQTAAGAVIGVSGVQWSKFERDEDRITAEQLARACQAMGLAADEALGLTGAEPAAPAHERDQAIRELVEKLRQLPAKSFRQASRVIRELTAEARPLA
jgi:transcriptional regulator with XRE-family HTH domain